MSEKIEKIKLMKDILESNLVITNVQRDLVMSLMFKFINDLRENDKVKNKKIKEEDNPGGYIGEALRSL